MFILSLIAKIDNSFEETKTFCFYFVSKRGFKKVFAHTALIYIKKTIFSNEFIIQGMTLIYILSIFATCFS
jgi:hypothetical protein